MSLSIRTNIAALNAQRNLTGTQSALDGALSRLSSGFRITRAGDDAAGLGISTKLEAQIRSYGQATRNANDGISVVQSAESALGEQASILTRLRELAMQSSSDGIGDVERGYVDKEAQALVSELQRISQVTEYNGTRLLANAGSTLDFQVGIARGANDVISLTTIDATTAGPTAAGPAGPGSAAAAPFAASGWVTSANQAFNASMLSLNKSTNTSQLAAQAALTPGAGATRAHYFSWAATFVFDTAYRVAGGTPGQETIVGAPNAFEQAGLDLVAATQNGGAGSGTGSALLASAYQSFASFLVSSNGNVFLASSQARTALGGGQAVSSAVDAATYLFQAHYSDATGGAAPPGTVTLGAAATTTALAALGSAYVPGSPATPATAGGLGVAGLSLAAKPAALTALGTIDAALSRLSAARADLGATGNRLQSAIANIQAFSESLSAANSRIRDVDVAEETSRMARSQILAQAGVAVLAQANQQPQLALKLLG